MHIGVNRKRTYLYRYVLFLLVYILVFIGIICYYNKVIRLWGITHKSLTATQAAINDK